VFTGIIEEAGIIRSLRRSSGGAILRIDAARIGPDLKTGDSVAVNGVCLTVVERTGSVFSCDLSAETLQRSSLGEAAEGKTRQPGKAARGRRTAGRAYCARACRRRGSPDLLRSRGEWVEMEFSIPEPLERYLVPRFHRGRRDQPYGGCTEKSRFAVAVIP